MPTCYVTTPYGKRHNPATGRMVDYDDIYTRAIKPAATQAGCEVIRADEDHTGGIVHKSILRLAISCDVFIADVGGGNANVMYELGIRHAAVRGLAILMGEAGAHVPFNISHSRVLTYHVDDSGRLTDSDAESLRTVLHSVIQQGLVERRNDSPVFEFYPGYRVDLPEDLRPRVPQPRVYNESAKFAIKGTFRVREEAAKEAEQMVRTTAPQDPAAALDVLKRYRDLSAWDDLIRFADDLPESVRQAAQVRQILALALNRRNQSGDRERAIGIMEQMVQETGGDGETFGILGRIYKDRFAVTNDPADMDHAIDCYRQGFEKEPSDYYPGVNLVNLLLVHGGDAAQKELDTLVPRVRAALARRMDPERSDYWELATALHLAAIAGEWEESRSFAGRIAGARSEAWMLESTIKELQRLKSAVSGDGVQELDGIIGSLQSVLQSREATNA